MSRANSTPQLLVSRGVYVHPYVGAAGERFAVAIDRRGRRVVEVTIANEETEPDAVNLLWDLLDRTDPVDRADAPRLRVIS